MEALDRQIPGMLLKEPQFRPHPATWLNQERWDDEEDGLPKIRLSRLEQIKAKSLEEQGADEERILNDANHAHERP